ncbi:MAG: hypothetical protein WDN46_12940 [Methylocella sp.]
MNPSTNSTSDKAGDRNQEDVQENLRGELRLRVEELLDFLGPPLPRRLELKTCKLLSTGKPIGGKVVQSYTRDGVKISKFSHKLPSGEGVMPSNNLRAHRRNIAVVKRMAAFAKPIVEKCDGHQPDIRELKSFNTLLREIELKEIGRSPTPCKVIKLFKMK